MIKVFFRADADKIIGYGHFIRTLALADMLKDEFDCTFFTQEPSPFQKNEINKICKLVPLPADDSKLDIFLSYLEGDEIVFLDNYFYTSEYQRKIKDIGCKLICLGTNDRHYYSDILFNFAERDPSIFSVEPYTQVRLGIDWVILREPFQNISSSTDNILKEDSIVICYGGTDQFCLTERSIRIIREVDKNAKIIVIATDSFGNERLANLKNDGIICHINASADRIAALLSQSKLLLSSASTITCEALACGTTVLCGHYVDNQIRMYEYLVSENLVLGLSDLNKDESFYLLREYLAEIDKYTHSLYKKEFADLKYRYISLFKSL